MIQDAQPPVYASAARECAERWSGTSNVQKSAKGWYGSKCPCHEDKSRSLGIKHIDGMYNSGWLAFKCHAGCDNKDIEQQAINDGFLPNWERPKEDKWLKFFEKKNLTPIEGYPYTYADGKLAFEKWRFWDNTEAKKTFIVRQPDGKGGWLKTKEAPAVPKLLYRLPRIIQAIKEGLTIYLVEGEKDVNNAQKDGLVATCNYDGGGKWDESYTAAFREAQKVVLVLDNDHVGYEHLNLVATSFQKQGLQLYYIELPGVKKHGDYSDFREDCPFEMFEVLAEEAVLWEGPVVNPWPKETKPKKQKDDAHKQTIEDVQTDLGDNVVKVYRTRPIDVDRVEWWTDTGNGKRFKAQYEGDAFYTKQKGWLYFDKSVYRENDGTLEEWAKETARGILTETDRASIEHLQKFASRSLEVPGISRMLRSAQTVEEMRAHIYDFDKDDLVFNSQSGIIDLSTGKLLADPRKYKCMMIGDCEFNEEAFKDFEDPEDIEALFRHMPHWANTLEWITSEFKNMSLLNYIQETFGYCLSGLVRQQQAWFFYGPGENCKSQALDHLAGIMGSYAKTVRIEMFMAQNGPERQDDNFSQLVGKRLALPGEVLKGMKLNLSKFKTFTGETDKITARFLNHEPFDYVNKAKLLFRGNYLPEIRDMDRGIWRRVVKVDFKNVIPEDKVIKGFAVLIKEDYPAMLAWYVRGCMRQLERGRLIMPEAIRRDTDEFKEEMDADQHFIDECLVKYPGAKITAREMSRVHEEFCRQYGYQPCNAIKLGFKLKAKGIQKDEHEEKNKRAVYIDYAISEEWLEPRVGRYSRNR